MTRCIGLLSGLGRCSRQRSSGPGVGWTAGPLRACCITGGLGVACAAVTTDLVTRGTVGGDRAAAGLPPAASDGWPASRWLCVLVSWK